MLIPVLPNKHNLKSPLAVILNLLQLLQKDDQINELEDLILGQMKYKKKSHYLELGETGLTKNLSTTGG